MIVGNVVIYPFPLRLPDNAVGRKLDMTALLEEPHDGSDSISEAKEPLQDPSPNVSQDAEDIEKLETEE